MTIETPCTRICRLDESGSLCVGCGRTGAEIAGWSGYSPSLRRAIMDTLPERLAARAPSRRAG